MRELDKMLEKNSTQVCIHTYDIAVSIPVSEKRLRNLIFC